MNRFVIIDGNAILHRAFHALPPLTGPSGQPTGAVYGFTTMLLKLRQDLQPTHMVVTFDRPGPTFRNNMYKEYQATRPKMDESLIPQVDMIHTLVQVFKIPVYEQDGYEADDVIGTIVNKISKVKIRREKQEQHPKELIDQVIIVTGDKDLLQLVRDENVYVYMPTKGLSQAMLYGEKEVAERVGVRPDQVADLKSLAGDSSDNYPGVAGVGPKTAQALLAQYQTVERLFTVLSHNKPLEGISEALRAKLAAGRESAVLSKTLATIRTDAPIKFRLEDARVQEVNTPDTRKFFQDLGFTSLLRRLDDSGKPTLPPTSEKKNPAHTQQELFS